jgi:hypothetical protein
VQNKTGGTVTFSSAARLNTGANTAVTLSSNTGATINFSGGGLDIGTTSGPPSAPPAAARSTSRPAPREPDRQRHRSALNVASTTIGAAT